MRALLAMCLFMPLTMSSVVAGEKEEFNLVKNDQGQWCGKVYLNRWTSVKRYKCKTQEEWEELGYYFPVSIPKANGEYASNPHFSLIEISAKPTS